jgi:hypothetical protein
VTAGEWALTVAALFGSGGLGTWVKVIYDRRQGISSNEREARREVAEDRRDTIADRDGLLARALDRLATVEARLDKVEGISTARADHIDVLEDWIWKGKAPPPPPRPAGI